MLQLGAVGYPTHNSRIFLCSLVAGQEILVENASHSLHKSRHPSVTDQSKLCGIRPAARHVRCSLFYGSLLNTQDSAMKMYSVQVSLSQVRS